MLLFVLFSPKRRKEKSLPFHSSYSLILFPLPPSPLLPSRDKIGAGFFATVFRAVEKKTGQEVAIKCIDKAKVGEKVAMLQEEVNILSKVRL